MPNLKGVDATKIIREDLGFKGIILGVTGYDLEEDIAKFLAYGADKVVMKPMTREKFEESLSGIQKSLSDVDLNGLY
jgi:CheY-like chemotaxis protein